jgi:hypothetical protein
MTVLSFRLEDEIITKLKEYASSLNTSTSSILRDLICRELNCPPPIKAPPVSCAKDATAEKDTLHNEVKQLRHEQDNLWAHIEELTSRLSELQQQVNNLPAAVAIQPQIIAPPQPPVNEPGTAGTKKHFRPQLPIEMVSLGEIIVPPRYSSIQPQPERIQRHIRYYERYSRFNGAITVMRDTLSLVDGYMRYLAAKKMGHKEIAAHLLS